MRYGSVCSGIEAASEAWMSLGWNPVFYSEIEKFPRILLNHYHPNVPLHGDFTTIGENDYGSIDLLVGGTPCQSFSIAGLRKGMDDDRGNLALEYLRLAQRKRPAWLVWENVPGVLSSNGGRDFGAFLGGLVELRYGFAYRVLDAQYSGVPQRRRRVFVVGYLGDWRVAAAVLFERQSLQRNIAPSREARKETTGSIKGSANQRNRRSLVSTHRMRGFGDYRQDHTASTLKQRDYKDSTDLIVVHGTQDPDINNNLPHPLGRNNGAENAIAIQTAQTGRNGKHYSKEIPPTLDRAQPSAVTYIQNDNNMHENDNNMHVRRLTPMECERLQGFSDGYTDISWYECCGEPFHENLGKYGCPNCLGDNQAKLKSSVDGHRYKALGNSMAVPVMHWIGSRIQMVNKIDGKEN